MQNDAMRNALEGALLPDEDTAAAEVTDEEVGTPDAQGTDEHGTPDASEDTAPEGDEATGDVPTDYFGVDLSALSAEERATIIAGFQERDKFIQQLLRNKAEEPAPADDAPPIEEATDQDLLDALGLGDPDDPFAEHSAKVALPLAKLVLSLQEEVTGLKQRTELEATERYWTTSLQALESEFGTLPVSHDEVMRQAAEAGVAEPLDAYWRIMGPGRQRVMAEVQKRRESLSGTLKKGQAGQQRPRTEAGTAEKVIDATEVKDAVRQAMAALAKERGVSFGEE